jgi:hypothetical protein
MGVGKEGITAELLGMRSSFLAVVDVIEFQIIEAYSDSSLVEVKCDIKENIEGKTKGVTL